jgi:hypothetical protein
MRYAGGVVPSPPLGLPVEVLAATLGDQVCRRHHRSLPFLSFVTLDQAPPASIKDLLLLVDLSVTTTSP